MQTTRLLKERSPRQMSALRLPLTTDLNTRIRDKMYTDGKHAGGFDNSAFACFLHINVYTCCWNRTVLHNGFLRVTPQELYSAVNTNTNNNNDKNNRSLSDTVDRNLVWPFCKGPEIRTSFDFWNFTRRSKFYSLSIVCKMDVFFFQHTT